MKYVCILESINFPDESYIGLAADLRERLAATMPANPFTQKIQTMAIGDIFSLFG